MRYWMIFTAWASRTTDRLTSKNFRPGVVKPQHILLLLLYVAVIAGLVALTGCSSKTDPEVRIEKVPVPVLAPCVAPAGRPTTVTPMKDHVPASQWAHLAPGAKAQAVKAQAGEHLNYEDKLRAATSACP